MIRTLLASSARLGLVAALAIAPALGGCGDGDPDAASDESDVVEGGLGLKKIKSEAQFEAVSFTGGGVVLPGRTVKFLIDARKTTKSLFFQNANFTLKDGSTPDSARFHYPFAQEVLKGFTETVGSFNDATYWTQDKKYFAGTIQTYELGEAQKKIYAVQFYPQDVIAEQRIVDALKIVKKAFLIPGAKMAFVATGPQQTTATVGKAIEQLGFANMTIDQVLGSIKYLPMNQGDAWGYLRIFPPSMDDLSALDIPVFDELPLDLTVVAATITKAFQDPSCHINLKSKERGTPDMVLRDAGPSNERLAAFADKPVHLVVGAEDFTIEPSTDAEVKQKLAEKLDKPWTTLPFEPTTKLVSYPELCPSSPSTCIAASKKYGSKGANLALLTNPKFLGRTTNANSPSAKAGYNLVPGGVAVPLELYRQFVDLPANAGLKAKLTDLIEAEKSGVLSGKQRQDKVVAVQNAFYVAQFPAGMVEGIQQKLAAALPGVQKLKVRSSANAEDQPNFDGAGLYSSYSANLGKTDNPDGSCKVVTDASADGVETKLEMSPKTLACAIKGVFASTWNRRAIEERSYARLDHATAYMGIAIVPKYDLEAEIGANSVIVTRVINSEGTYGYTFSSQVGNNLVTNPTPGTLPESTIAAFSDPGVEPSFVVTRYATPDKGKPALTHTVLSTEQMKTMLALTQTIETAYCKAKPGYYDQSCANVSVDIDKPMALDLEMKILENGHFVVKQMREFSGH